MKRKYDLSVWRPQVVELLTKLDRPVSQSEISVLIGVNYYTIKDILKKLCAEKSIRKKVKGNKVYWYL